MKNYEVPTIEFEAFDVEDIITTSGVVGPSVGEGGLPIIPG